LSSFDPRLMREALIDAIPEELFASGRQALEPRNLYLPFSHAKALSPDNVLVVGIRGAGKTVWWQALLDDHHRRLVSKALPFADIRPGLLVTPGFGQANAWEGSKLEQWPDKETLRALLREGFDGYEIWRTVVLSQVAGLPQELDTWGQRVAWVSRNGEAASRKIAAADAELSSIKAAHLVLFDALDRTSESSTERQRLLASLLSLAFDLRTTRAIRIKIFVRPDMLDEAVRAFPDASKVLSGRVDLRWARRELYGLLWQRLANSIEHGAAARGWVAKHVGSRDLFATWSRVDEVWQAGHLLRNDETLQDLFGTITGPWMGTDARRGVPFTWLPNHLVDGLGQVSPRSFLSALRHAALDSQARYPHHPWALHYESIKRGVAAASSIRVHEVEEDYPWVKTLLEPMRGLKVPCTREEFGAQWSAHNALTRLEHEARRERLRDDFFSVPGHLDEGPEGVFRDLRDIGVLTFEADGRLNLPDVYRVGYGILRKGGVKPARSHED